MALIVDRVEVDFIGSRRSDRRQLELRMEAGSPVLVFFAQRGSDDQFINRRDGRAAGVEHLRVAGEDHFAVLADFEIRHGEAKKTALPNDKLLCAREPGAIFKLRYYRGPEL